MMLTHEEIQLHLFIFSPFVWRHSAMWLNFCTEGGNKKLGGRSEEGCETVQGHQHHFVIWLAGCRADSGRTLSPTLWPSMKHSHLEALWVIKGEFKSDDGTVTKSYISFPGWEHWCHKFPDKIWFLQGFFYDLGSYELSSSLLAAAWLGCVWILMVNVCKWVFKCWT